MHKIANNTFPENYSHIDKATVHALLDDAERSSSKYDGNWRAHWLLSNIHDIQWVVRIDGVTAKTEDGYLRTKKFNWDIMLCDGTKLSDSKHIRFLQTLQKISYLSREYGFHGGWEGHEGFCQFLSGMARWLYLHRDIYDPTNLLLSRLDAHSIRDYFHDYSKGGIHGLLKIPQQILYLLYENALKQSPPETALLDIFSIPNNDRLVIRKWLQNSNLLNKKRHWVTNFISHLHDQNDLRINTVTLRHNLAFQAFLCQFEYDIVPNILFNSTWREFPSHKSPLRQDVISSLTKYESMARLTDYWRQLFELKRHIPEAFPDETSISKKTLWNLVQEYSSPSKHTPWIPLKDALTFTNEALRWVHIYGKDIIALYLNVAKYVQGLVRPDPIISQTAYKKWRIDVEVYANSLCIPSSLEKLNLRGYFSLTENNHQGYERLRSTPTICDAMQILIGATAILIGFLKPIRESELRHLSRNCTELVVGDGYWLNQAVRKKKVGEKGDNGSRPIPYIVAKAIELMRTLSDGLKEIDEITDSYLLEKLFIIKIPKKPSQPANLMSAKALSNSLDTFCDYVNLPTDEHGRRWYLRIHESRKSFLIVLFWCYRYSSLDAARWMAMHGDVAHLYAYIQANFPGDELPGLEAQYSTRQLWNFESYQNKGETDNIEELYNAVCNHFNVTKLNLLSEKDIEDWLEIAFMRGVYKIQPYSIKGVDEIEGTRIAFRISNDGDTK